MTNSDLKLRPSAESILTSKAFKDWKSEVDFSWKVINVKLELKAYFNYWHHQTKHTFSFLLNSCFLDSRRMSKVSSLVSQISKRLKFFWFRWVSNTKQRNFLLETFIAPNSISFLILLGTPTYTLMSFPGFSSPNKAWCSSTEICFEKSFYMHTSTPSLSILSANLALSSL